MKDGRTHLAAYRSLSTPSTCETGARVRPVQRYIDADDWDDTHSYRMVETLITAEGKQRRSGWRRCGESPRSSATRGMQAATRLMEAFVDLERAQLCVGAVRSRAPELDGQGRGPDGGVCESSSHSGRARTTAVAAARL